MSFSEADLHRLLDGELTPAHAAEVAAWIAADPARAAQAAALKHQHALLHERYDPLLAEPVPAAMLAAVNDAVVPAPPTRAANQRVFLRVAGMLVLALVCGIAGWFGHARFAIAPVPDAMTMMSQRAAVAHAVFSPEVRHPVEVAASDEAHLVRWLSARLAAPVRAPNLNAQGYALVGGRLLPGEDKPVAQFMYQNADKKRLTLYVSPLSAKSGAATRESSFRFERFRGVNVFYWAEGGQAYALSGDLAREEMMPVTSSIYEQLQVPSPAAPGSASSATPKLQP
jgi:anti-sigma factor RsiW